MRARPFVTPILFASLFTGVVACGGGTPEPTTAAKPPEPKPAPSAPAPVPTTLPIAVPEVAKAPATCKPLPAVANIKACKESSEALGHLAAAAAAERKGDKDGRDSELALAALCEKVPVLVAQTVAAELGPIECAETVIVPAIEAHGKAAFPPHLAAARALVSASRLSRLRPKKGAFDAIAKAEVDKSAADSAVKSVLAWKEAVEKEEGDAIVLAKGAPAEIRAIVLFEIAAARIALARELRATPFPEELRPLAKKDPDLETTYYAKLDEVTMPILEQARAAARTGLDLARHDGIHVRTLPSFAAVVEPFKSRPGFESRPTRELDLLLPDPLAKDPKPEVTIAATLPPWAVYAMLERAAPASLLDPQVLTAMAVGRGIPAALRMEAEKERDKKTPKPDKAKEALGPPLAITRVRIALAYGSRPDAEAIGLWAPKEPADQLRVAVAKALLGPTNKKADAKDSKDPKAPDGPKTGYALEHLDALAKKGGAVGLAAAYDAALLSLDAAQIFGGEPEGPLSTTSDPRKAYEEAIKRLDAIVAQKGLDPARADHAKKLADGARETLKLLEKKAPPPPTEKPAPEKKKS